MKFQDIKRQQKEKDATFEQTRNFTVAIIREISGDVIYPYQPSYVWVSEFNQPQSIYGILNLKVNPINGLQVIVGYPEKPPYTRQVLGIWDGMVNLPGYDPGDGQPWLMPPHHLTHEQRSETNFGADVVQVFQPAIQTLRTTGNGINLTVAIQGTRYWSTQNSFRVFNGVYLDLTSYVPVTASRKVYALICLDRSTGFITVTLGVEVADDPMITAVIPSLVEGVIPSAAVLLHTGQTSVNQQIDVVDTRSFVSDENTHLNDDSTVFATGLYYGGMISINPDDASQFDVTAGEGVIVDNVTDPMEPVITPISIAAVVGESILDIDGREATYIFSDGFSILQQIDFSPSLLRQYVYLGALYHEDHTEIQVAVPMPIVVRDARFEMADLAPRAVIDYSPAIGLTLFKSLAEVFLLGINFYDDFYDPNTIQREEVVPESLLYLYQDGSGGWTFENESDVQPGFWDDGTGTLNSMSGTDFSNQLICYHIPTGRTCVYYGQQAYSNIQDSLENLLLATQHSVLHKEFLPMYWLTIRGNAVDFTDVTASIFTKMINNVPMNYVPRGENYFYGDTLGFYGTAPITKPTVTGSRGGNAALASLLTELANLGLIVNSTSP